jgi:dethiobiotin synthetase
MHQYVITGIGTDVGKTVVSAILSEALKASYWKPVQAGDLDSSDSMKINELTKHVEVLEEGFRLSEPMSPHAAAEIDGIQLSIQNFEIPNRANQNLIIEGAGGLLVPLNSYGFTYADLFKYWNIPVIVVSRHYLGSINHTLMTVEVLQQRAIPIEGIVFIGDENKSTEDIILRNTKLKMIARIPEVRHVDAAFVKEQAARPEFIYSFR